MDRMKPAGGFLPPEAEEAALRHIALLDALMPGALISYFVVGSAALGDFLPGGSDVDFIALTRELPDRAGIDILASIHRELRRNHSFAPLDGWYLPTSCLAGETDGQANCPRFNDGKYLGLRPFIQDSPDGWVLRKYGIRAAGDGPAPTFPVDWDALLKNMAQNLDTYWRKWIWDGKRNTVRSLALLMSPLTAEWGVLGIARLYYTFRERDVISKTGAGDYALKCLPARWHGIIREALAIRQNRGPRISPSTSRRKETLAFMEYMLDECARVFQAL